MFETGVDEMSWDDTVLCFFFVLNFSLFHSSWFVSRYYATKGELSHGWIIQMAHNGPGGRVPQVDDQYQYQGFQLNTSMSLLLSWLYLLCCQECSWSDYWHHWECSPQDPCHTREPMGMHELAVSLTHQTWHIPYSFLPFFLTSSLSRFDVCL